MDRGLGLLGSINKAFWKKMDSAKSHLVHVQDVSLEGVGKGFSSKSNMGSIESSMDSLHVNTRLRESSLEARGNEKTVVKRGKTVPSDDNTVIDDGLTSFSSVHPATVDHEKGLPQHMDVIQRLSTDESSCKRPIPSMASEQLSHCQNSKATENKLLAPDQSAMPTIDYNFIQKSASLVDSALPCSSASSVAVSFHANMEKLSTEQNIKTEIKDSITESKVNQVRTEPETCQLFVEKRGEIKDNAFREVKNIVDSESKVLDTNSRSMLENKIEFNCKDQVEKLANGASKSCELESKNSSELRMLSDIVEMKNEVSDPNVNLLFEGKSCSSFTGGSAILNSEDRKCAPKETGQNATCTTENSHNNNTCSFETSSRRLSVNSEKEAEGVIKGSETMCCSNEKLLPSEEGSHEKLQTHKLVDIRRKKDSNSHQVKCERRMSEACSSRRSSSRAMSPDGRRGSGAMSPLAFDSIQEKILALSKENSHSDAPKREPKVKKLDNKFLAVVKKETVIDKTKDVVKVSPKINTNLQSKILKFGAPSVGAKIPVKKVEPEEEITKKEELVTVRTCKAKKKVKPKAPQPPTDVVNSEPPTPVSERKVKHLKGRAPAPPGLELNVDEVGEEPNQLLRRDCGNSNNQNISVMLGSNSGTMTDLLEAELPVDQDRSVRTVGNNVDLEDVPVSQENKGRNKQETPPKNLPCSSSKKADNGTSALSTSDHAPKEKEVFSVPLLIIPHDRSETDIFDATQPHTDTADDDKTPSPSRRSLKVDSVVIESKRKSLTPDVVAETLRIQEEMNMLSQTWRESSDSESFHTPSPRLTQDNEYPVMYSSKGEVIESQRKMPLSLPLRQQSPSERELFTPEGSPLSDFSDDSYDHYVASVDFSVRSSSLPRRVFPQNTRPWSFHEDWKENSPVVFDARLSFDLAARATPVRQLFSPVPAYSEPKTSSNSLSCKIAEFLSRTDHVMEEWRRIGRGGAHDIQSLVELPAHRTGSAKKSKSAANIMIKGFQYYSRGSSKDSWRGRSISRYSEISDSTLANLDELNEMTADLAEERASGSLSAERLEAETAERIRLEQELSQVADRKSKLEQTVEQMELELYYAKGDVNGLSESETDWEDCRDGGVYKQKCTRLMREVEMLRSRLQQQHEDDLEQLVGLKKQLEKKLADAYEEVDEQRQIVAQWKRKSQKLQADMNDLRLILEQQTSRNNLLEKKQRKFDMEIQMLQDELKSERNLRDRVSREKEVAVGEKYSLEQSLSSVRLELELKEEKLDGLSRELEEFSIGGVTEQDMSQLRKNKHDLEMKIKDQEDELDDLAGQVSILESAKLKLEMSLENLKKEHRKEVAQKEEEIDDVRSNAMKKLKALEASLEQEHEERTLLLREKHELERRLKDQEERGRNTRAADEDAMLRLRKDLRKTKALLRDANVMLDRAKQDSPSKATLRALKNQLEDSELARAAAVKAKQSIEAELSETSSQLEEANRGRLDAESRAQAAVRQSASLRSQLEENEEELSELMKKYRQALQHLTAEQSKHQETICNLSQVEAERNSLQEQLAELTARLEAAASVDPTSDLSQRRLETRIKDMESRLELEATVRARLEVQISRLKENLERTMEECDQSRTKEQTASDQVRKLQRSLRECKEELALHIAREQEANQKRRELEKRLEAAEQETSSAKHDLRLSIQRVEDLQHALSAEISDDSDVSSDTETIEESGLLTADSTPN